MIPRDAMLHVLGALEHEAAVLLTGPRQAGKTTLALEIARMKGGQYLDLESRADRVLLNEPVEFLRQFEDQLVVLDEIHRVPDLFADLRGIIDSGRRKQKGEGRFLILGSASIELLRQAGESLAGRIAYVQLFPLSVREVEDDLQKRDRLWLRGGFPASCLAPSDSISMDRRLSFVKTYLERDVPQFGSRVSASAMEDLWAMIAHLHGSIFNASHLARSLETSVRSVNRHIDLLCDLFLVRKLQPYRTNIGKRLVKSPKIYVRDSGLLHALLGIGAKAQLERNPVVGMSWEGFAVENLVNALPWGHRAYYYRTARGAEMDLVIERPDRSVWAVEIKRSLSARPGKGFHIARKDLGPERTFVVHSGEMSAKGPGGIEIVGLRELATALRAPVSAP